MASYDISGDAPIKIEASPALDCIAQIEKLKAEGAALAKANKWDEAMSKYGEVVEACVASMGTVDLGVPRCCGAFTPSTRVVSGRAGGGWFLFRF